MRDGGRRGRLAAAVAVLALLGEVLRLGESVWERRGPVAVVAVAAVVALALILPSTRRRRDAFGTKIAARQSDAAEALGLGVVVAVLTFVALAAYVPHLLLAGCAASAATVGVLVTGVRRLVVYENARRERLPEAAARDSAL